MKRLELEKIREKENKGIRMRSTTRTISTTAIVLMLVTLSVFAQSAFAAQISVNPECQIVSKGDYFTVNIHADPEGIATVAGSYNLYFDNALLSATTQAKGTFLSQGGASTFVMPDEINNTYNATHGVVIYGESQNSQPYGVTTPGVLGTVTFEAIADGFCELELGDWGTAKTELIDTNLGSIPTDVNDGGVRVGLCGDVNDVGDVNIVDVIWTFKRSINTNFPLNEWAANVNNDVSINIVDVIWIFKRSINTAYNLNCRCGA